MATLRQKALAKKIVENHGLTMKDAMLEVGYSANTAVNPKNVTESKGWQELVDTMLPDEKLLSRHAEGLNATKIITSHTEPDREYPDYAVRKQYVELGYRVKRRLADPVDGATNNTQNIYMNLSDEQLTNIIRAKEAQIGATGFISGEGAQDSGEPA